MNQIKNKPWINGYGYYCQRSANLEKNELLWLLKELYFCLDVLKLLLLLEADAKNTFHSITMGILNLMMNLTWVCKSIEVALQSQLFDVLEQSESLKEK